MKTRWVKVFKNGPSKICVRQPLKLECIHLFVISISSSAITKRMYSITQHAILEKKKSVLEVNCPYCFLEIDYKLISRIFEVSHNTDLVKPSCSSLQ